MIQVHGAKDASIRCKHYHGSTDIIAIKFKCCKHYYACIECHEALTNHTQVVWEAEDRNEKAILCGDCKCELTIEEYLISGFRCPNCHIDFNPRCSLHYHRYFDDDLLKQIHILQQAREYVKVKLTNDPTGHDWWHIFRVTELAKAIGKYEGANGFLCEMGALFHDLADEKLVNSKKEALSSIEEWLGDHHLDFSDIKHILTIIESVSYRGGYGKKAITLESQVVQDADRLDAIGAIGIARAFVYAGAKGQLMHDPTQPPREHMTEEQYRQGSTAINHFYEKLLKLRELLHTEKAKQMAIERHQFMELFLERFQHEWATKA